MVWGMDDQERTYLLETIHALERSLRRWKLAAGTALAALVLTFLFLGTMNVVQGYRAAVAQRRARVRAVEAELQAETEMQLQEAESAKRQADAKERK
jgi:hypothetical protein